MKKRPRMHSSPTYGNRLVLKAYIAILRAAAVTRSGGARLGQRSPFTDYINLQAGLMLKQIGRFGSARPTKAVPRLVGKVRNQGSVLGHKTRSRVVKSNCQGLQQLRTSLLHPVPSTVYLQRCCVIKSTLLYNRDV